MRIPPVTLKWWNSMGFEAATAADIMRVEAALGQELPADYKAFVGEHGFVEWDIDIPDSFDYRLGPEHQPTIKNDGCISHLWPVRHLERMAADQRSEGQDGLPLLYPNTHFPIGGTPGQDQILLELTPKPGRIWFWPEREDPWGTGDNTELGFVAETFTAFIEGLRMGDL